MIAGLRPVALKELGQKVEVILLKGKKYVMFTKLCQCIKSPVLALCTFQAGCYAT